MVSETRDGMAQCTCIRRDKHQIYIIRFLKIWKHYLTILYDHKKGQCDNTSGNQIKRSHFCYESSKPFLSLDSLKLIYHSYFHSVLTYGIIFWGNTPHSNVIFKMQKKIVMIMTGIRNRDSCREHFKRLKILPLQTQYLLSLLLFVAENTDYFRLNSEIHSFNTKNKCNLHLPHTKLTIFQKGLYYAGIKVFNNLPTYIKKPSAN